jgi:hypothetical protein
MGATGAEDPANDAAMEPMIKSCLHNSSSDCIGDTGTKWETAAWVQVHTIFNPK